MRHFNSFILKAVLISFVSSNYLNTSLRERIPNYLQEICPGSGVCLNDIIDPDNDLPSCCGECSCSADCEVNGNCCFQNQNNGTIASTRLSSRYHSECIYPIANHKAEAFHYDVYQPYYMVSSTEKDTISYGTDNITVVSCGEVKVAPWGSLHPVYSKSTGKIYKNSVCADEHNITDGELWRAYVLCDKMLDVAFSPHLQNGSIPDHCYVNFFYKGGMYLMKSEICYHGEHYGDSCSYDSFGVSATPSLSVEEIIAFCESGLISPYNNDFANVFCFLCSTASGVKDYVIKEQDECIGERDTDFYQKSGVIRFTIIFDDSEYSRASSGIVQTDRVGNANVACPTPSTEQTGVGCRTISCPLGQILSRDGGCFFPGNKWYTNGFSIIITLSSERTIDISTLYSSIQNLKSPWPNSWTIFNVLYEASAVPMQTRGIVVIQYIQFYEPFSPKSFFSRVNNYISEPWLLKTNNGTITLQAQISGLAQLKQQVYTPIYNIRTMFASGILRTKITKLYLCDNVNLLPSEFSIGTNPVYDTIFNSITNKTLFDWEYVIDDKENGVVCLEDSGLYRVASNNSRKFSPFIFIIIVQCLAIIYVA